MRGFSTSWFDALFLGVSKQASFLASFWSSFRVFGTFFTQTSLMLNLWPKFVLLFLYPYATPVLPLSCLIAASSHVNPQVLHIFSSFHCSLLKTFCVIQTFALGRASFLTSNLANWKFWEQFCSILQEIWHLIATEFFCEIWFHLIILHLHRALNKVT